MGVVSPSFNYIFIKLSKTLVEGSTLCKAFYLPTGPNLYYPFRFLWKKIFTLCSKVIPAYFCFGRLCYRCDKVYVAILQSTICLLKTTLRFSPNIRHSGTSSTFPETDITLSMFILTDPERWQIQPLRSWINCDLETV